MTFIRRYRLPLIILVAGLALAAWAAMKSHADAQSRYTRQLDRLAERAALSVENKLALQTAVLRGGAALFDASDTVTDEDFRQYVARQDLTRFNPGIGGVGLALYAEDAESADRQARILRSGEPLRPLWPRGEREDYSIIAFLEPENERNRVALGFDMMSEPNRRAAMERARTTGEVALSSRVELVQEIDENKQAGFLLYMPVSRIENGTERFLGWVYSPLRAGDLFSTITDEPLYEDVEVGVYDGEPSRDTLLFENLDVETLPFPVTREVEIGGNRLVIRVSPTEGFYSPSPVSGMLVTFLVGSALAFLVALLSLQQLRARLRTQKMVEVRTRDLQQANESLIAEAAARADAESQIRHMQKMEAVGQLSGGIAHDFNNMLAIITGNVDMARRLDDSEKRDRALERAMLGANKAGELTQRLLAFSRRQTLMPETVDCNRLVAEMSELVRRTIGAQVQLETVLAGGIWPVTVDPSQLENALVNLAVNARDAMPDGGRLTIETSNCHLDSAYAAEHPDAPEGQFVLIAVSDTGTGMSAEVQAKAVDPFFTTKEVGKGTGLGLSQVFGFLKQSGGHFSLYSEEGEGTTIKLYLPRAARAARPVLEGAKDGDAALPVAQAGEVVLVVEDEPSVREMSVSALESLGYATLCAANGEEALALVTPESRIDLLFTDVVMPRMDGRRLADAVAERRPDLPILFTTGFTPNAIVHNERLDEGVRLLSKPFSIDRLAVAVRDAIDHRRTGRR